MGFGSGSYGSSPYGSTDPAYSTAELSSLSSSRKINAQGRYEINDEGGFEAVSDSAQRVQLLVAFATSTLPKTLDNTTTRTIEARIREALAPLTDGRAPYIKAVVDVTRTAQSRMRYTITFRDLRTDTTATVEASL